jgi:cytochrome bd-type quinol oxidase subunit 2
MKAPFAAAVAIAIGLIILAGYFLDFPILQSVRTVLLGWAVSLIGVAAIVGIVHLIRNQWKNLRSPAKGRGLSVVLILSFLITLVAGLVLTPAHPVFQKINTRIQVPVEASLLAVISVILILAGVRLFQRKKGWMAVVFLISAILYLLIGSGILFAGSAAAHGIGAFLMRLPVAGGRGILLGVALGSLVAGIKILFGTERPYNG